MLETNEDLKRMYQNLWNISKAVLREMFIAISAYVKKLERYQVNGLTMHLKNNSNVLLSFNSKRKLSKKRGGK